MLDINIFRSVITVLLFVAFIALCIWAWSKNRKTEFDEAANMPFQDEPSHKPLNGNK